MKLFMVTIVFTLALAGCVSPTYTLKQGTTIDELGVCVDYDSSITDSIKNGLDSVARSYIQDHNREEKGLKLAECSNPESSSFRLSVNKVSFITPAHRAASLLVTMAGCITPFAMIAAESPFYIWFAYFPKNVSLVRGSLSPDIDGKPGVVPMQYAVRSGGAFVAESKLKMKNEDAFYNYLENSLTDIAKLQSAGITNSSNAQSQQGNQQSTGGKQPSPWDYLDTLGSDDPYLRRE